MKYSCPVYPQLRNANTEIQMICIRTPTVWQRAVKLLVDCIRKKRKSLQESLICHRPLHLKQTRAAEGLIMGMFVKSQRFVMCVDLSPLNVALCQYCVSILTKNKCSFS